MKTNPFLKFSKRPERNKRETRISPEQERALFAPADRDEEERRPLDEERYVFGSESGAYVASFDKSWRGLFRHAGLPVGRRSGLIWHDLRHEFVSHLVDEGGEIHEVKEAARHKDIRTTERYMTAKEERLKALMAKMATRGVA